MPYVEVFVDAGDVLADLTDDQLRSELQKRAKKKGGEFYEPESDEAVFLREALEERDWRKAEELAEKMGVYWFRARASSTVQSKLI